MARYTQQRLERILGIGTWWSMRTAAKQLRNISQSDLRDLLFGFPSGIGGVLIQKSKIFKGNEDFMFVGTAKEKKSRLQRDRLYLLMSLRKAQAQAFPSLMRSIRADISTIDRQLKELKEVYHV